MFAKKTGYATKQYLFCFMLMIVSSWLLFSYSGPDEALTIIIETEPDIPFVGLEWKLSLFVDYPEASNVFAETPLFSENYVRLDRVRTEPYLMHRGENSGETWTRMEFFFVPLKPGQVTIPPFEITTPEKTAFTPLMIFQVEAHDGSYVYQPELHWAAIPDSLEQGRASELLLVIQNNDPKKTLKDSLPVSIDIPQNVIMERIPLRFQDRERNGILRLKIIPLKEGNLSIDPIAVDYEGMPLVSPSLRMKVISASLPHLQSVPVYSLPKEELNFDLQDEDGVSYEQDETSFLHVTIFPEPLKKQYHEIINHTNKLWNNDKKVEAIAFMRKAERDEIIGYTLRPLRKKLEQELGLGITEDEIYLPVNVLCAVFFTAGIILVLYLFFFKKKQKSFPFFRIVCYILLVICIVAVLIFGGVGFFWSSGKNASYQAVVYRTDAYRVPEFSGAVSGFFQDGETALIRSEAGEWLYLETGGGKSGWVPRDKVIRY